MATHGKTPLTPAQFASVVSGFEAAVTKRCTDSINKMSKFERQQALAVFRSGPPLPAGSDMEIAADLLEESLKDEND